MNFKSMQRIFWVLIFVFLIFVPGSKLNAIEKTETTKETADTIQKATATTIGTSTLPTIAATLKATRATTSTTTTSTTTSTKAQTTTKQPSEFLKHNRITEIVRAQRITQTIPIVIEKKVEEDVSQQINDTTIYPITTTKASIPEIATTLTTTTITNKNLVEKANSTTTKLKTKIETRKALPNPLPKHQNELFSTITIATREVAIVAAEVTTSTEKPAIATTEDKTIASQLLANVEQTSITAKSNEQPLALTNDVSSSSNSNSNNKRILNNVDSRNSNSNNNQEYNNHSNSSEYYKNNESNNSQLFNPPKSLRILQRLRNNTATIKGNEKLTTTTAVTTKTTTKNTTTTPTTTLNGNSLALIAANRNLIIENVKIYTENELEATTVTEQLKTGKDNVTITILGNVAVANTIAENITVSASEHQSNISSTFVESTVVTLPTTTTTTTTKPSTRRPYITTTLKPPPTIDDYQTITSQAGTHAYLPCNVKQLVKKPISWLRVRDGHILTVDQTTFIADQRFQSIYTTNPERWSLQIKYVQPKDAGTYECQVSTEPKASAIVNLRIVEPKTELIGESTRHVKAGSQVKLRCIISQALEPPLFINWFYNQKQIYLHNRKGWRTEIERIELPPDVTTTTAQTTTTTTTRTAEERTTMQTHSSSSVSASANEGKSNKEEHINRSGSGSNSSRNLTFKAPTTTTTTTAAAVASSSLSLTAHDVKQITTASLIIPSVVKQDSGNYTCIPSNSAPMTVVLHVLNGEYSASAIKSGASGNINWNISKQQLHFFHCCNVVTFSTLIWIIKLLLPSKKHIWNFWNFLVDIKHSGNSTSTKRRSTSKMRISSISNAWHTSSTINCR